MTTNVPAVAKVSVLFLLAVLILLPTLIAISETAYALGSGLVLSPNDQVNSDFPQVAVSDSSVYVAWRDASQGLDDIFFISSLDNGVTFSGPVNLSNNDGASSPPLMAVSDNIVYVVWSDNSLGNNDIFLRSSSDGINFSDATNISNNDGSSLNPQLAISDNIVYVAWEDSSPGNSDIFFASSSDVFNATNISNNDGSSTFPKLVVSDGIAYVVWSDNSLGNNDIFLRSSADGVNFSDLINISNNDGSSLNPQLTVSDGIAYVAWEDSSPGNSDIFFASSSDGFNATNISNNDGSSTFPKLAVSDNIVYVTWQDDSLGNNDIFLKSSSDGVNFGDLDNVSSNDGDSGIPQILTSDPGNIHVAWTEFSTDESNPDASNFEIFLSTKTDGNDFGCPINLSASPGHSLDPVMVLESDGSSLLAVWHEVDLATGILEVRLQNAVGPLDATIVINPIGNIQPFWGIDEILASGSVANAADNDKVVLDWGDETSEVVDIAGCSWGPVPHSYDSSAAGTTGNVTATLAAGDTEKDTSAAIQINVLKHPVVLTLDPIASVKQGADITGKGSILDGITGEPISGANITFVGPGATGLSSVLADPDGLFSSTGPALNSTQDNLTVNAHFEGGQSFESVDSGIVAYDIASSLAIEFAITAGSAVHVDLTGFNASIDFDEISDGFLLVSKCDSADPRFIALDMCLRISPAVEMAGYAVVTMSFAGKDIPSEFSANDIDLFHQAISSDGTTTVVDVTWDRNLETETLSGRVAGLSNFIGGIAKHDTEPEGAHRTQLFLGDGNVVSLRDINNPQNSTLIHIGLDKESYKLLEDPVVTVIDANGNVDPEENDIVTVGVMSETSAPLPIWVTLHEDSVNSNTFSGSFGLDNDRSNPAGGPLKAEANDELQLFYAPGARFQAMIDGVTESGLAQLWDFSVGNECFEPVGSAVKLQLVDSKLEPGARISVNMSYANAVLGNIDPSSLRMIHRGDDLNWVDITLDDDPDPQDHIISGEILPETFTKEAAVFSLGINLNVDCGGGAGGGFGRGLIVDAVASVARQSSGGGGGSGGGGSATPMQVASPSSSTSVQLGEGIMAAVDVPANSAYNGGRIMMQFEQVVSPGNIDVREESLSAANGIFDSVDSAHGTIASADGSSFKTAGPIFDINPSAILQYEGMVEVTIPYAEALASSALGGTTNNEQLASAESNIRFLHFDGESWQDLTTSIDEAANTVTGKLSSFSQVVAAVVDDGTFSSSYFIENPVSRLAPSGLQDSTDPIGFVDALSNPVSSVTSGSEVRVMTSFKNLQRTAQQYLYVVEVFDSQGVVVDLDTFTGTVQAAQAVELDDGSFRAEGEDREYTVKVFMLDEASGGSIFLAPVIESQIAVVSGT